MGPGHFHMEVPRAHFQLLWAYWVCSIFKTPIFNPKFPLQSISFSQITEISAPEHHHFRVFAATKNIILKFSPSTAGLLRLARARSVPPALRARSGAPTGPRGQRCYIFTLFRSGSRPLERLSYPCKKINKPLQSPTFFHSPWHIPTKMWVECPPPPPPGVGGSLRASGGYAPPLKMSGSGHSFNLWIQRTGSSWFREVTFSAKLA